MKKILTLLLVCGLVSSCSTPAQKAAEKTKDEQLTQKIQDQEPADSAQQIMRRAAHAFSNAPGLTAEQKMRLGEIYTQVYIKSMKIRREIGQAKSLMFVTLAKVDYDSSDIRKLKSRIVKLDQDRLEIMFIALEDVQKVVGRGVDVEKIYKYFEDHEIQHYLKDTVME